MSYSKSSGKPFEYASKISHRHIIADKDIQQYINKCVIPFEGKDVELNPSLLHDITYPTKNRIQNIIAIDGGYTTIAVKKKFPSSLISYFQFGTLLIERKYLEGLHAKPFISPKDMAELKKLMPDKLALPTKNLLLEGQTSLKYAVRKVIYDFFMHKDQDDTSLMNTLYWFLFRKYEFAELVNNSNDCTCSFHKISTEDYLYKCTSCNNKAYQLSRCPNCEEPEILLNEANLNKNSYIWKCPHCREDIFLTDVFRMFEAVDNELGAGGVLGYLLSAIENLLLVHIIRILTQIKHGFLDEFLLVKDGPLSFVGQTANMYKPMRHLLNFLRKNNNVNIIGIEKSGAFVDHAKEIADKMKPGQIFLMDNDHIYKYIMPADGNMEYARTSYYGGKFIYKSKEEKLYVLTLPVETHHYYSRRERAVNVFCHCLFDAGVVIDKRFHAGILVRFLRRIPVKRNKKVGIRLIGHLRLFKRRLINIGCAGINDRDTLPGKKLADRDGEGKIVILFPASLIDSARITSPVSGINYDSIGHKIKAPENTVLLTI